MPDVVFPVTCPTCKEESLSSLPAATIERTHSFRPISTRRYYPGEHALEIQVNGTRLGRHEFLLGTP